MMPRLQADQTFFAYIYIVSCCSSDELYTYGMQLECGENKILIKMTHAVLIATLSRMTVGIFLMLICLPFVCHILICSFSSKKNKIT